MVLVCQKKESKMWLIVVEHGENSYTIPYVSEEKAYEKWLTLTYEYEHNSGVIVYLAKIEKMWE